MLVSVFGNIFLKNFPELAVFLSGMEAGFHWVKNQNVSEECLRKSMRLEPRVSWILPVNECRVVNRISRMRLLDNFKLCLK